VFDRTTPFAWRRRWYSAPGRQHELTRPVISVGNLAFGGRGKTPTVAHIARLLIEEGERPSILSRGYAREQPDDGVVVTSDGRHLLADVDRSGDEPMLLARQLTGASVFVCDERALAGALAERVFDVTVHLLDDGFQHLHLARDLDLVIVAAEDLDARPMPFGTLREPVSALKDADAVLFDEDWPADESAKAADIHSVPAFTLRRSLGDAVGLDSGRSWRQDAGPVVALAGIARPERFARALVKAGWTVSEVLTFADHHRYSPRDLRRIADVAARTGSRVLTTTKDAMRLLPCRPLPVAIAAVPLEVTIEPADAFRTWLFSRLREIRA
jgi:tetraacyldisaccharide 4'-kinase